MDNKKYLDKVIGSLVRGTKLDYNKNSLHYPFSPSSFHFSTFPLNSLLLFNSSSYSFFSFFLDYCRGQFGLIDDEIEYVWNEYREIIKDKIKNGE